MSNRNPRVASKDNPINKNYIRKYESLVDEVAAHANIRRDVTRDIMRAYHDIMAERLLNDGWFKIPGIITMKAHFLPKGATFRKEPHYVFRARFSQAFKKLLQVATGGEVFRVIDRNNWRQLVREFYEDHNAKKRKDGNLDNFLDDLSEF